MPPRKRATKAEVSDVPVADSSVFEGLVFSLAGVDASIGDVIESLGGTVSRNVTKKVTHLVTSADEVDSGSSKVANAQKNGAVLITEAFVTDCKTQGKLVDVALYVPKTAGPAAAAAAAAADVVKEEPVAKKGRGRAVATKADAAPAAAADDDGKDDDAAEEKATGKRKPAPKKEAAPQEAKKVKQEEPAAAPAPKSMTKISVKGRAAVDPLSRMADKCHVLEVGDDVYDVTLNQTNIGMNNNKFYVIQVLERDDGKQFYVWNRWGRIGLDGQNKLMPMPSRDAAIASFKSKYKEKSANAWENRANFVHRPGKYEPVEMDYSAEAEDEQKKSDTKVKTEARAAPRIPDSKLPEPVQDFIKLICDVGMMKKQMVQFELDTDKMPLGKISKAQIMKGYSILKEIETALSSGAKGKCLELSNRFYTAIPHKFGMRTPPVINTTAMLQSRLDMLEALGDLEIAANVMKTDDDEGEPVNPIDAQYEKLNCDLVPVPKTSEEFKMINKYIKQTHGSTHDSYTLELDELFTVNRAGEAERFKPFSKLHNKRLLWHGSRLTNWCGILSQGLRIAPPEAPVTGYMFGKGVYFADMVSKSANYCCTQGQGKEVTGVMLLSEVALGDMYELKHAEFVVKPPHGKHSTWGQGRYVPDPDDTTTIDGDVMVPWGKQANAKLDAPTSLQYNEFIVYDTAQVKMRYVLRMKFKHRSAY